MHAPIEAAAAAAAAAPQCESREQPLSSSTLHCTTFKGPSLSTFDQTFLSVGYAKKSTRCHSCAQAILPQHVKLGLVRHVMTLRFPCIKTHWFHPGCVTANEMSILRRFGSHQGKPIDSSVFVPPGWESLSTEHQATMQSLMRQLWELPSTTSVVHASAHLSGGGAGAGSLDSVDEPSAAAFTEVGKSMKRNRKRKTKDEDDEFLPAQKQMPKKKRFAGACRIAVQNSISRFKEEKFGAAAASENSGLIPSGHVKCAMSDEVLSPAQVHVDHAPPNTFDRLVESFMADYGRAHHLSRSQLLTQTEYVGGRFFDHGMASEFDLHHSAHASLRLLSASCNLKLPRKQK
jgi:hypothetical protein